MFVVSKYEKQILKNNLKTKTMPFVISIFLYSSVKIFILMVQKMLGYFFTTPILAPFAKGLDSPALK